MAIPTGLFLLGGAGLSSPGGAFSYLEATVQPNYFAGTFFIDTGYDDPGSWYAGLQAAEIYGARVYGATGTISPSGPGAGTYTGRWQITASPVWSSKFYVVPHSNPIGQQRVLIRCDAWLCEPISTAVGAYQRLESVDWTLYRL